MKNVFNLKSYLATVFAAKGKKDNDRQIETKLNDENKGPIEANEITENQLKKDRKDTEETIIEKKLEKNRTGASSEVLVEKSLNDSKSKMVKHRNEDAAKGNINKLEEKRIASKDKNESNKQEASSETEKDRRFYNNKSPDGLKLAKQVKLADNDFDIGTPDWEDDPFESLDKQRLSNPEKFWGQQGFSVQSPSTETIEEERIADDDLPIDIQEELKKFRDDEEIGDLEKDPDFLHSIFSEKVVAEKDIGGTKVRQVEVDFDLRDVDGDLIDVFKLGPNQIDDKKFKGVMVDYIKMNNPDAKITEDSIDLSEEMTDWTGKATYFVPVK